MIILFLLFSLLIFNMISDSFFYFMFKFLIYICITVRFGAEIWDKMALFHYFSLLMFNYSIKSILFKHFMNWLWRWNEVGLASLLLSIIPYILDSIGNSRTWIS